MNGRSFSLKPFSVAGPGPEVEITGNIGRPANTLTIRYDLRGKLGELAIPAADLPARRHALWEETCFELFLGVKNSPPYWEFNLSPGGPWNVYRFAGYRQGRQEEKAVAALPFRVRRRGDSVRLTLELDLDAIVPADRALEVGIAAVLKLARGGVSYWALTHGGPQADFHRRDGFIIQL
jgi:hypothetical protein